MAKAQDIEYLPPGWRWVPAGKEKWITSTGEVSTARHGRRGNETMSTRQVQNYQRARRAEQGTPKAPTVHRTGRIRTVKGGGPRYKKLQTDVTPGRAGKGAKFTLTGKPTGVGTIYNEQRHGYTETWVFRTFDDAQQFALLHKKPVWASKAIIQIRFTDRLNTTDKVGSDETGGPGYASLTNLDAASRFFESAVNETTRGTLGTLAPWEQARQNINNYDMTGDKARVYIYLLEK